MTRVLPGLTEETAVDREPVEDTDIAEAATAVRRFLASRVHDGALVEDITQESVLKLVEARDRLGRDELAPYAVTVAKNLIIGGARSKAVAQRHLHRLASDGAPPAPDDLLLRKEDGRALRTTLEAMPDDDRELLVAHVVRGEDTASLAAARGGTAGGVAARLARARARARVDFLLASRGVALPSDQCRAVLLSLSAADKRRQGALDADGHVSECSTCADLVPALVERRRPLIALLPFPILARMLGRVGRLVRTHAVASVGGVVAATAAVGVLMAGSAGHHRQVAAPRTTAPRPTVTSAPHRPVQPRRPVQLRRPTTLDARALLALPRPRLRNLSGHPVVARNMAVLSVDADEGFWIGEGAERRIWVELVSSGESAVHVTAGDRISFDGKLSTHAAGFASLVGVDADEGARRLTDMGAHIDVNANRLRLSH